MSVTLESAVLDAISHNQEIGKQSGLLEKKVYLSVTKKDGVSKVSCVALNWIQRLARMIFGCYSDTHFSRVISVLSDENIRSIKESRAYVLNRSLRKTVKSLIRLREKYLKSYKPKHQETRVASALDSLIAPILKKREEKQMSVLDACLEVMMIDKDVKFKSAVDSIKVPQEDELAQLELRSRDLKEQKEKLDREYERAKTLLRPYLKENSEEIDEEKLASDPTIKGNSIRKIEKSLEETKRKIEYIGSKIKENQERINRLTIEIFELKAKKFIEEITCFLCENLNSPEELEHYWTFALE